MSYAVMALTFVGMIEAGLLWFALKGLRRLDRVESRLAHLTDALTLLAETAESGFRASALEIARLNESGSAARALTSRTATRRMAGAARRGRSVSEIAAAEQVAEGEVRLRLHLAETGVAARLRGSASREAGDGAVRS